MSVLNGEFWKHLLGAVGAEVGCLAVLAFACQRFLRSGFWRRAVWQTAVICSLALLASEWTGLGRGAANFLFGARQSPTVAAPMNVPSLVAIRANEPMTAAAKYSPPKPTVEMWWPAWIWLAGATAVLGRLAIAQCLLLTLRWRSEGIDDAPLRTRVENVARRLGLRRKVGLLRMSNAISPMAFGIFSPTVGLPAEFETKFSAAEQEAVLAHELAHLAAMDPFWFLIADFASALLWWHPAIWWMRHSLHAAAELAADETVALLPDGPDALANCLVALTKEMTASRMAGWAGINGEFRSKLRTRVERLMRMPSDTARPLASRSAIVARIAMSVLFVPTLVLFAASIQSAYAQRQDDWRSQMRESWNSSPGALLMLAALQDNQTPPSPPKVSNTNPPLAGSASAPAAPMDDEAVHLQNGRRLYDFGNYDEAEAVLKQIKEDSRSYQSALYFLSLINDARAKKRQDLGKASAEHPRITSLLDDITVDHLNFDAPLSEVLEQLHAMTQQKDPAGVGVAFIVRPVNVGGIRIKTTEFASGKWNLRNALDIISYGAKTPIAPSVIDEGVVFSTRQPGQDMHMRVFKLNTNVFMRRLSNIYSNSISSTNITSMARAYFAAADINLDPPKNLLFDRRVGALLISAPESELSVIDHLVAALNWTPPQVLIESRFVYLSQEQCSQLGLDSYSNNVQTHPSSITNLVSTKAVLSGSEFRKIIDDIEKRTSADILAAPKGSTESGRPIHIGADGGVSAEVSPEIFSDGFSIQLALSASIKPDHGVMANVRVSDGQTLMCIEPAAAKPSGRQRMVVFITPRIIDAAGKFVHTDEEMLKQSLRR